MRTKEEIHQIIAMASPMGRKLAIELMKGFKEVESNALLKYLNKGIDSDEMIGLCIAIAEAHLSTVKEAAAMTEAAMGKRNNNQTKL